LKLKLFSVFALFILLFTGCSQSYAATQNLKNEADSFQIYRKVTGINLRSDKVLYEIEGFLSYENEVDGDLSVVIQTGPDTFIRDVLHVSPEVTFLVQQLDASQFDPYHFKVRLFATYPDIEFGPEEFTGDRSE
jgi:hypothetical protein